MFIAGIEIFFGFVAGAIILAVGWMLLVLLWKLLGAIIAGLERLPAIIDKAITKPRMDDSTGTESQDIPAPQSTTRKTDLSDKIAHGQYTREEWNEYWSSISL